MQVSKFFIPLIFLLAFGLRFAYLGSVPNGLNRDEAAFGYNAYSVLTTGRDEWNQSWPLMFQSFGDYKMPGYLYSLLPSIAIFGLNNFAVRLPSALAGMGIVLMGFLIARKLFNQQTALLTALFLAISPWAVFYSRTAFESNLATFLVLVSWYFFLKSRENFWWFLPSIGFGLLSLTTYFTPYIVLPLVAVSIVFSYRQNIFEKYKHPAILLSFLLLCVGLVVIYLSFFANNAAKNEITLWGNPTVYDQFIQLRTNTGESFSARIMQRLIDNKVFFYGRHIIENIFANFSPQFLAARQDKNLWNGIPDFGHIYLIEYFLFLLGFIFLVKDPKNTYKSVIFTWLVAGVLPAAMTIDGTHPNRDLLAFVAIEMLAAYGFSQLLALQKTRLVFLITLIYFGSFLQWGHRYFVYFPNYGDMWNPGLQTLMNGITSSKGTLNIVINPDIEQAYIFLAYYDQLDPKFVQTQTKREMAALHFYKVKQMGDIHFEDIKMDNISGQTLYLSFKTDPFFSSLPKEKILSTSEQGIFKYVVVGE